MPIPAWGCFRRLGVIIQSSPTSRIDRHLLVNPKAPAYSKVAANPLLFRVQ
jgi:hypothetical protein